MDAAAEHERPRRALLLALARNRGELDPAALERLLRRLEAPPPAGTPMPRRRESYRRAA